MIDLIKKSNPDIKIFFFFILVLFNDLKLLLSAAQCQGSILECILFWTSTSILGAQSSVVTMGVNLLASNNQKSSTLWFAFEWRSCCVDGEDKFGWVHTTMSSRSRCVDAKGCKGLRSEILGIRVCCLCILQMMRVYTTDDAWACYVRKSRCYSTGDSLLKPQDWIGLPTPCHLGATMSLTRGILLFTPREDKLKWAMPWGLAIYWKYVTP